MKKLLVLIILAGVIILNNRDNNYFEIPSTSIRIRVIARSNSEKDQRDKMVIKSLLEDELYKLIGRDTSYQEVDNKIKNNLSRLDNKISEKMKENHLNYGYTTSYGYNYFPEKEYRGIKYSSGNYKSYVVKLGDGEGDNWWCVLYPPICLVDENVDDYEYHSLINDLLIQYN